MASRLALQSISFVLFFDVRIPAPSRPWPSAFLHAEWSPVHNLGTANVLDW
jgi:hypothetical protein